MKPLSYARAKLSHAARLGNLEPPITRWCCIKDNELPCSRSTANSSIGVSCIHPDQIALTHEVFTPSE